VRAQHIVASDTGDIAVQLRDRNAVVGEQRPPAYGKGNIPQGGRAFVLDRSPLA
jgi:hypothetical protein